MNKCDDIVHSCLIFVRKCTELATMCSAISGEVFVADHLIDEVYIFCVPCDAQFRKILDFLNHKKSGECTSAIDTINVNKDINFNLAEGNSSTSSAKKLRSVKFTHYKSALICQFGNNDYRTKCIFCESIFAYFSLFVEHFSTCQEKHGGLSNILTSHVIKSEEINIVDDDTKNFDARNVTSFTDNIKNSENIVNTRERLNCSLCANTIINENNLIDHTIKFHGQMPLECDICGKYYVLKSALIDHKRSHGERPYECKICSVKFKSNCYLSTHNRLVHTGERPFQCDQCKRSYQKKYGLKRHIKSTHCESKISRKPNINKTIKSKEISDDQFECKICSRKLKNKTSLKMHSYVHTEDRPFECGYCQITVKTLQNLRKHIKKNCVYTSVKRKKKR